MSREPEAPIHQPAWHRGDVRHTAAQAARVGDTIWVFGQLGIDASLSPGEGMEAQARLALQGLKSVLEAAGAALPELCVEIRAVAVVGCGQA